jgi:hypothetical protein
MTTKAPKQDEQKTRSLRMDDARWKYFKDNLGAGWLRVKIDEAVSKKTKVKHSDQ